MKVLLENVYATLIKPPTEVVQELYDSLVYDLPNAKWIKKNKLEEYEVKLDQCRTIEEMRRIKDQINYWANEWDGKVHLFDKNRLTFPAGLLYVVEMLFPKIEIHDNRSEPTIECDLPTREEIVLKNYQERAMQEMEVIDYRCILHAATSAGKTVMAIEAIKRIGTRTLIIIPNNLTLIKQWHENIDKFIHIQPDFAADEEDHRIMYDAKGQPAIMIATTKLLYNVFFDKKESTAERNNKYRNFIRDVGLVIYDECHRAASPQSQAVLERVQAYHRLGLTATPDMRTEKNDIVYHGLLGPNVANITRMDIVEEGIGIMPHIRFINVPPRSYPARTTYQDIYEDYICDNDERDKIIYREAIMAASQDRSVLVLVGRVEHAKRLGRLYDGALEHTYGDDPKRFEKFEQWMNGEFKTLVCTTQLVGEGFDYPALDAIVLADSWKSQTRTIQSIGRLMRAAAEKYEAIFIDFANNAKYLYEHTIQRATHWYKEGFELDVRGTFLENYIKSWDPDLEEL